MTRPSSLASLPLRSASLSVTAPVIAKLNADPAVHGILVQLPLPAHLSEQTVIAAPVDGILIGRSAEPGDVAQPGKELMVLAPAGETQIVVQIDEKNLSQLRLGQKALASADIRDKFAPQGLLLTPGTSNDFANFQREDMARAQKIITEANIRVE